MPDSKKVKVSFMALKCDGITISFLITNGAQDPLVTLVQLII